MNNIYKAAIGIVSTGFLTITSFTASAATINFELKFFDESNVKVGSGSFGYEDEEKLTCFQITGFYDCYSELELTATFGDLSIQEIENELSAGAEIFSNPLTSFSAEIYGVTWNDASQTFWADEESGQIPGYVFNSRSRGFINRGTWFFSDSFFGEEQFVMNFDRSSDISGGGTWLQSIVNSPLGVPVVEPGVNFSFTSGTFEARRVGIPEPSSVFSILVAMAFAYSTKRKLIKSGK